MILQGKLGLCPLFPAARKPNSVFCHKKAMEVNPRCIHRMLVPTLYMKQVHRIVQNIHTHTHSHPECQIIQDHVGRGAEKDHLSN